MSVISQNDTLLKIHQILWHTSENTSTLVTNACKLKQNHILSEKYNIFTKRSTANEKRIEVKQKFVELLIILSKMINMGSLDPLPCLLYVFQCRWYSSSFFQQAQCSPEKFFLFLKHRELKNLGTSYKYFIGNIKNTSTTTTLI